jgi:cytochrome c-type biogenesis protein CcmH|tara:strand:+ start:102 stop:476 length:375 start_codon:yes stop_codon:yes gene_type:complete
MKKLLLVIICLLISTFASAEENTKRQIDIHKNLRCLICQGQSVADSNSDFAQTLKLVVKDLINEGKSNKEIYSFLISKYGEWIVYKPSINVKNFALWFTPYLILLLGGIIIFTFIKKAQYKRHK